VYKDFGAHKKKSFENDAKTHSLLGLQPSPSDQKPSTLHNRRVVPQNSEQYLLYFMPKFVGYRFSAEIHGTDLDAEIHGTEVLSMSAPDRRRASKVEFTSPRGPNMNIF
jgi:hypothetical protein